jgi:hypothetical protein
MNKSVKKQKINKKKRRQNNRGKGKRRRMQLMKNNTYKQRLNRKGEWGETEKLIFIKSTIERKEKEMR